MTSSAPRREPRAAVARSRVVLSLIGAFGIVMGLASWLVWRRPAEPTLQAGGCRGCNLLLITIDTLRLDRVGAFGGSAGLTPELDRLAAEGVRLTRTYSPAPLTLPSHASILTAVSPPVHGIRANGLFRLGAGLPTLATVLQAAGYRTGAFVGAFVLDARFGLNRGFDVYDDRYSETGGSERAERRAEEVIRPATAWILQGETNPNALTPKPWFSWVHLYDPHDPYRAPEPYASRHAPYDAEVAYADATVGRLIADLRSAGQLDRTLVVVTADHGEALGDHGEPTHGVFAYDVTQRVPWILWGPRLGQGSIDALVRLVDLAPTALDLLGVAQPSQFEGVSVVPLVNRPDSNARVAYVEAMDASLTRSWAPLAGVVSGGYKLIDLPVPELYDLTGDPGETTNLFPREPDRARTLKSLLASAIEAFGKRAPVGERTTLGAEARRRLQALGYVASNAGLARPSYGEADDPKVLIPVANDLNRAIEHYDGGDRPAALSSVTAIVRTHPRFSSAYTELARMQRTGGDLQAAIRTMEEAARQGVANQRMMTVLAGYLAESRQLEKAKTILEAVLADHPDDVEALNSLGVVASRMGNHDAARVALKRAVDLDPTSARAYANLAADRLAAGRLADAVPDLQRAVELDPQSYDALFNLGMALWQLGRQSEAMPHLERFVREAPARYAEDAARVRALVQAKK